MDLIALFVGIVIGAMLGVLGCLAFRRRDTEGIGDTERQLAETIAASGRAAMESNTKQFLTQADEKFKTSVEKMEGLIAKNKEFTSELEMHRKDAYVKLHTQVNLLREGHEQLNQTTGKLASTLRDPIKRGKWGEQQLRNVLELAGMVEGQDFIEQTGAGDRPDVVLRLKSDGQLVIDAKAPLSRYLEAMDNPPGSDERQSLMEMHAKNVVDRVKELSKKEYWAKFQPTPEAVVMFVPMESALVAALAVKPRILEEAMERKILIATPTLLLGLLKAVAWGWTQHAQAMNVDKIVQLGSELHERIGNFRDPWTDVGKHITKTIDAYNKSVGSIERNLLVSARKLHELRGASGDPQSEAAPLEAVVRQLDEQKWPEPTE